MIGVRLSKKEYNSSKEEHSSVLISSPDHTNLLFTIEYNETFSIRMFPIPPSWIAIPFPSYSYKHSS